MPFRQHPAELFQLLLLLQLLAPFELVVLLLNVGFEFSQAFPRALSGAVAAFAVYDLHANYQNY